MSIKQWEKWAPGAHIFLEVYKSFFKLVQAIAEDAMEDMRFLSAWTPFFASFVSFFYSFFHFYFKSNV